MFVYYPVCLLILLIFFPFCSFITSCLFIIMVKIMFHIRLLRVGVVLAFNVLVFRYYVLQYEIGLLAGALLAGTLLADHFTNTWRKTFTNTIDIFEFPYGYNQIFIQY